MSYYELKQGHLRSYSDVPIFNLPTVTCISCSTGDLLHKMSNNESTFLTIWRILIHVFIIFLLGLQYNALHYFMLWNLFRLMCLVHILSLQTIIKEKECIHVFSTRNKGERTGTISLWWWQYHNKYCTQVLIVHYWTSAQNIQVKVNNSIEGHSWIQELKRIEYTEVDDNGMQIKYIYILYNWNLAILWTGHLIAYHRKIHSGQNYI